jgi:hypothetical protein
VQVEAVQPDTIKAIAGYVAIAIPVTVAIANLAKVLMEWLTQYHSLRTARIQQDHQITTHYLDRALDPAVPLAIRHQLLRFLATPDRGGSRLTGWATAELQRIGGVVDDVNRAVVTAEKELHSASTAADVEAAERSLAEAVERQRALLEPALPPPPTAAAARAGMIGAQNLKGLVLREENLSGASFSFQDLQGADFSKSDLSKASLQGCDLRAATFRGADLTQTRFPDADLRGAVFAGAVLRDTYFARARLEGADFSLAKIEGDTDLKATFDDTTKWPEGFDPRARGGVYVGSAGRSDPASTAADT